MWKIFPKTLCLLPRLLLIEGKESQEQGLHGAGSCWSSRFGIPPISLRDKGTGPVSLGEEGAGFGSVLPGRGTHTTESRWQMEQWLRVSQQVLLVHSKLRCCGKQAHPRKEEKQEQKQPQCTEQGGRALSAGIEVPGTRLHPALSRQQPLKHTGVWGRNGFGETALQS